MKPLTPADLPAPEVFDAARAAFRARIIAHKAQRRVQVGPRVTLLFEDRETLRWQVLEMCRVEGTRSASGVQHELDVYNELMPGERELSATLFIEITELANIRPELDRLIGLDEHVELCIGDAALRARFDEKQMEADRLSAVQYLRFVLGEDEARAFCDPNVAVAIAISHPAYAHEAAVEGEVRAALVRDLQGGCAPLLDFAEFENARASEARGVQAAQAAAQNAAEALRLFPAAAERAEEEAFALLEKVLVATARARAFAERARRSASPEAQAFEQSAAQHEGASAEALAKLGELCERKN